MSRLKTDAIRNVNASVDGITLDTSGNVAIPNELQLADKIVHTGDTNTAIRFPSADVITAETSGTERIRVTSGGLVLLGSSTSDLSGNHSFISIGSRHALQYGASAGTYLSFIMGSANGDVTLETSARSGDYPPLIFKVGGSERLRVTSAGKVGIGTASPTQTLHVHGASGSELPFHWIRAGSSIGGYLYSDGGGSGITGGDGNLNNTGIYLVTNTRLDLRVGGSERLRINSSGAVSIASNNYGAGHSSAKLRVGTESGSTQGTVVFGSGDTTTPALTITNWDGSQTQNWSVIQFDNSGWGNFQIGGTAGADAFAIYDDTVERFRIDSNGMSKFTRGSTGTVGHFYANARESNILIQNDARTWKIVNYDYGYNGTDHLGFHDGTTDRVIIQNTGGISFNGDTATSNALSDYEEGTATFQLHINGGEASGVSYSYNTAPYVKVGKMVYCAISMFATNLPTTTGVIDIVGLPFTDGGGGGYR